MSRREARNAQVRTVPTLLMLDTTDFLSEVREACLVEPIGTPGRRAPPPTLAFPLLFKGEET
jgi:hypothetical protein